MIWESYYWKSDLLKYSKRIASRKKQLRWVDATYANTEKDIMLSAFMIRKLFDSDKVDKRINKKNVDVIIYKSNSNKINKLKNIFPERYFDIETPTQSKINIKDICNQIIHSYIFILIKNEKNELQSFCFASDYDKFKHLIEISIDNYISIVNEVGNYYSSSESYIYDNKKQDYIVYHDDETIRNNFG